MRLRQDQCLLVLTNADLYPKDGWTFVFGMTKCSWRICIQSYARHHPDFAKARRPGKIFDNRVAKLVQYRAIKTACHELCHVLSMRHCQAYECLMNGSSQLDEADQKPFALCPICLRKLSCYLSFEGSELERYQDLRTIVVMMQHEDQGNSFSREIELFDRIINELYSVQLKYARAYLAIKQGQMSVEQALSSEGGNFEFIKHAQRISILTRQD